MGASCCNESKSDAAVISAPSEVSGTSAPVPQQAAPAVVQKDLPSISLEGKDVFEKFELSLPFSRT
jgi:hypothetical protein